jgi:hypothetical protein
VFGGCWGWLGSVVGFEEIELVSGDSRVFTSFRFFVFIFRTERRITNRAAGLIRRIQIQRITNEGQLGEPNNERTEESAPKRSRAATRTRSNTNPNGTEANAADRFVRQK